MGGNIAGIEAEIVMASDTRGIAGARIPGLAARDGGIIHKIESTHQVAGGMILRSVRAEAIDMTHIGAAMTAAIVATEIQTPTVEGTALGGAPQHFLALTKSVMMPGKMVGEQRSKLGN